MLSHKLCHEAIYPIRSCEHMIEVFETNRLDSSAAVRTVFSELWNAPGTASDLARRCRMDECQAGDVLQILERCGAVRRTGEEMLIYHCTDQQPILLGIDLGGTKIHVALGDLAGAILSEEIVSTDPRGGLHVLDQLGTLARQAIQNTGQVQATPMAVCLGSPGVVDVQSGSIDLSGNIPDFDKLNIVDQLRARFNCPILIENDVNLAALGEQRHGSGRGHPNFAYVAIGTGIGMGLVTNGELVRGARGAAGEIAFLPLGGDPFASDSYLLGPLETAIGSVGIVRYYHEHGGSGASTVKDIFEKLTEGEPAAIATLDRTARLAAQAIMAIGAIADPGLIVLGGGIGSRVELLERLNVYLSKLPVASQAQLSLLGTRAAVIGALSLASEHVCRQKAPRSCVVE
jgi:predicted NBD/HSP70 family sugar kinase